MIEVPWWIIEVFSGSTYPMTDYTPITLTPIHPFTFMMTLTWTLSIVLVTETWNCLVVDFCRLFNTMMEVFQGLFLMQVLFMTIYVWYILNFAKKHQNYNRNN